MRLPSISVAVALALGLAAAGCGGGDGSGDRLSKEELAEQANAICREFEQKIDALGEPQSLADVEAFADDAAAIARDGREELGELRPPEDVEAEYARLLETLDEAIQDIERVGEAAADGDADEVGRIAEAAEAKDEESDRIAASLGLSDCGNDEE